MRPTWVVKFVREDPELNLQAMPLPEPPTRAHDTLADVLDRFLPDHAIWWGVQRLGAFLSSLSAINIERLETLRHVERITYASAYRRTRNGKAVWEIRADNLSGCLRTASGGSSKQAVVEAGR